MVRGGEDLVERREVLALGEEREAWVRGASSPELIQRTKAIRIVQMQ